MGPFSADKILVSTEEFFALYRGIAEARNDPDFGPKNSTEERLEGYAPIKIAAISAGSFRAAVERISRHKQLTCPRGDPRRRNEGMKLPSSSLAPRA